MATKNGFTPIGGNYFFESKEKKSGNTFSYTVSGFTFLGSLSVSKPVFQPGRDANPCIVTGFD